MRQRVDDRAKKQPPASLEKSFKEIVVGAGRAQEPYVIAFHYASDNVASHSLGTLFGFFEVEIHDQDAAYIVNFLASVAKKEYFANPRRNPTDSFDAALHKINVALAEIVKHGNISWLGHLHGAIGAVNGNILHFSVTGDGELYLAREGNFQSISAGLADTGSEPHPLKTFTEVSSGDLFDGDLIITFSPSVWSLFSPEDLARSLNRLGPAGFERFLRTALINELPVAAAAMLLCSTPVEVIPETSAKKEAKKQPISLENVWSGTPFSEALQSRTAPSPKKEALPIQESLKEEYTDKKTGHIYVQASSDESFEAPDTRWKESWGIFLHHFDRRTRSVHITLKKSFRRVSKESGFAFSALRSQLELLQRIVGRRMRLGKRSVQEKWRDFQFSREKKSLDGVQSTSENLFSHATALSAAPRPSLRSQIQNTHLHVRTVSNTLWETLRTGAVYGSRRAIAVLGPIGASVIRSFERLSLKHRLIVLGIGILFLGLVFFFLFHGSAETLSPSPITETTAVPPAPLVTYPPAAEPLSILLENNQTLAPSGDASTIALATINDAPFLITKKSITDLKTQQSVAAPEPLRLATGMDDLDSLFVLGESGTLYLFSVTTKKFETNILPLAVGTRIDMMAAYLTYLYILDEKAGAIYRFPRAEGGFGAPTPWSKETLSLKEKSAFAVYENIMLTEADGKPLLYSRGKNTGIAFAGTVAPVSASAFSFSTKTGDIFALDRSIKRIVRWSSTGVLIKQYFHESFGETESITVSSDGTELLTSEHGAVTSWRI